MHYNIVLWLDILCVTYLLTSITMPDPQTRKLAICVRYRKWCQRFLWHQLTLASGEFYIETNFLDGDLCKKIYLISIFSIFFQVFKHEFIRCVDLTRIATSNRASTDVTN